MINKRTLGGITSAVLMLLAGQALSGGTMKCGIHIIHDGGRYSPSKYEVLKKCGEPTFRQGNTWVYDTGRGTSRMLRFNNGGYLASMQEGPR